MSGWIDEFRFYPKLSSINARGLSMDGRASRKSWLKIVRSPVDPESALELSLANNIKPQTRDNYGNTLLHYAAQERNLRLCKYLVGNGWYALERNDFGRSPVDFSGDLKTKEFLVNHIQQADHYCSRANETNAEVNYQSDDVGSLAYGSFRPVYETVDPEAGDWNLPDEIFSLELRSQETEEKDAPEHATDNQFEGMVQSEGSSPQLDASQIKQAEPRCDRSSDYYSNVKLVVSQKVCETLDISEEQLWQLVEEGSIPSCCVFQMGTLIRFNLTEILERGFS